MNVSTMRRADRWLGIPVCFLFTRVRKLLDLVKRTSEMPVQRILFVKLAEQGSTVLAYSALRRAVDAVGRENVFFLVFQENRFILDVLEVIPEQNVICIPTGSIFSVIFGAIAAIRRMRAEGIDAAIDMEFFARSSAALTYLSGARRRVGFHAFAAEASYRGDLMTHRLSYNPHLHTSIAFRLMVDALDHSPQELPAFAGRSDPPDTPLPEFRASADEVGEVEHIVRQATGSDRVGPLVLLNGNCSDILPVRRWPPERYVELAGRLIEAFPELYVAFTGAPDEAAYAEQLVRQVDSQRCACLAGKTTLRQLLILYTLAEVLVTNDSGPAHFAALTPIDVVTLFGPETPALFAARTPRNHVLWSALPCSPCVNAYNDRLTPCRNNICLQKISVEQVFDEVSRTYESRRTDPADR